jgi:hypothetical protein
MPSGGVKPLSASPQSAVPGNLSFHRSLTAQGRRLYAYILKIADNAPALGEEPPDINGKKRYV